jgi:hypothetical protein
VKEERDTEVDEMANDKQGEIPDPEKLREMFQVFSENIPDLLTKITDVLYGVQQGEKFGQSVAGFFKALRDAGMTNEQAFALTKEYMSNMSLGGMMKNMIGGATQGHAEGSAIRDRIRQETDK